MLIIKEKVGVHRSKCTPTEILSLPTVSAFLLVLLLLCLLVLAILALLLLTVLAFNLVGDGLRDAFDPKMKR